MTGFYPRDFADAAGTVLENMPVVVATGMRQTGKTTFLCSQPELGDRINVSFDDFAHLEAAKSEIGDRRHKEASRGWARIAIGLAKTHRAVLAEVARRLGVSTTAISKIIKRAIRQVNLINNVPIRSEMTQA